MLFVVVCGRREKVMVVPAVAAGACSVLGCVCYCGLRVPVGLARASPERQTARQKMSPSISHSSLWQDIACILDGGSRQS
jgi:hypothetical protein